MKYEHFVTSNRKSILCFCSLDSNFLWHLYKWQCATPFMEIVNEANRALIVPLIEFPVSTSGKRTFKFQSRWYELHSWLEYSVLKDAAFCFYCRCFGTTELYLIYLEIVLLHLVSQKCVAKNMADFGLKYVIMT